jgi:hypothetical protein
VDNFGSIDEIYWTSHQKATNISFQRCASVARAYGQRAMTDAAHKSNAIALQHGLRGKRADARNRNGKEFFRPEMKTAP